uniref:Putative ATP-binding protein n=1 Tax=Candidatus Methanogaster sp. ANME-2c ERB4 TaxID=2759911 RepID=A0A7G9YQF9_9EURY|nr:putative ATP-binding protein [Methanosarcinales archaeon ANME-2c ERB4]QNO50698.1 putative ATP-binding protein [Methanosarcinales archaeon ANME-2c ERB4]
MMEVTFYDREQEIKEVRDILRTKPRLITFIYGPINSGKTEMISHLIEQLPDNYVVFYINLRTKFLATYDDFIESLFEMEMEMETDGAMRKRKETLAELVPSVTKVTGIPITREFIDYVFKDNKPKNAFSYMIKLFEKVRDSGKHTVLVLDELQKIGDVKVNGPLVYELFNFFVDLTKELHLCHVFAITSDSLFIERVYSEAMLEERCKYLLVDDFDYRQTMDLMGGYGFDMHEKEIAWHYVGGKPVSLVRLINEKISEKNIEDVAESMLKLRTGEIRQRIGVLTIVNKKILFEKEEIELKYDNVTKILDKFLDEESYAYDVITPEIVYLVKENILFVDPVNGIIKPQSQLNLLAIRGVMRDA